MGKKRRLGAAFCYIIREMSRTPSIIFKTWALGLTTYIHPFTVTIIYDSDREVTPTEVFLLSTFHYLRHRGG